MNAAILAKSLFFALSIATPLYFSSTKLIAKDNQNYQFAEIQRKITPDGISYTDQGSGTPLILIHVFAADQRFWEPQIQILSSYFRVITIDLIGFGKSVATDGSTVSMKVYATEVKTLLDYLHIDKAIIGGESMGGFVALEFLRLYPQIVEGMILSNTSATSDSDDKKRKREQTAQYILHNPTSVKELAQRGLSSSISANASKEEKAFLKQIFEEQATTGLASGLRGILERSDNTLTLQKTNIPILIISADKDTIIPKEESENMHKITKNSRLVIMHGAGHLTSVEQPQEWNKAVIQMFNPSAKAQ